MLDLEAAFNDTTPKIGKPKCHLEVSLKLQIKRISENSSFGYKSAKPTGGYERSCSMPVTKRLGEKPLRGNR